VSAFGSSAGDLNFEVGRKGLRTFAVEKGRLKSPMSPGGPSYWDNGIAVAECRRWRDEDDRENCTESPNENCRCGLYAMHTLDELFKQYGQWARQCVAVIACQGTTYIGTKGLKTASAQIIAYWTHEQAKVHLQVFRQQCPEAVGFTDIQEMLKTYGFPECDFKAAEPPRYDRPPPGYQVQMGPVSFSSTGSPASWSKIEPLMRSATPGGVAAVKGLLGIASAS
jgi:hypothetical protein